MELDIHQIIKATYCYKTVSQLFLKRTKVRSGSQEWGIFKGKMR